MRVDREDNANDRVVPATLTATSIIERVTLFKSLKAGEINRAKSELGGANAQPWYRVEP
jgi:hypothetical protein